MKYKAKIDIMPLESLLDPQGKAVSKSMESIDLKEITNVRIGKHITLNIEAKNIKEAIQKTDIACKKILVNPIIESCVINIDK